MAEGGNPAAGAGSEGFVPISSQEEFDARIRDRLARAEKSTREPVEGEFAEFRKKAEEYDALLEQQKTDAQKQAERMAALEKENAAFKRKAELSAWAAEVSKETGVPASLLRGESLEEMKQHAEDIKAFASASPGYSQTPGAGGSNPPMSKEAILAVEDPAERRASLRARDARRRQTRAQRADARVPDGPPPTSENLKLSGSFLPALRLESGKFRTIGFFA